MKGLILAAGKGTRLFPLTMKTPKPLLVVNGKMAIKYCIDNLINAGIKEIGIVINPIYEDMFRGCLMDTLSDNKGLTIKYIHQEEAKGIAHAVYLSKEFINGDKFICLLGDNIFFDDLKPMKTALENYNDIVLTLKHVDNPEDYGVAAIDEKLGLVGLVEKPKIHISNLAVMGSYGFSPYIFEAIENIQLSARGEYEITDAIDHALKNNYAFSLTVTDSTYFDIGTFKRLKDANNYLQGR